MASDTGIARRVRSVRYRVVPHYTTIYEDTPDVEWTNDLFHMRLSGEVALFTLIGDFFTSAEAIAAVEDRLRDWQIVFGLERIPDELVFINPAVAFERVEDSASSESHMTVHVGVKADAILAVRRATFPAPPSSFRRDSLVEQMYQSYCEYRRDGARLTALGEYCLTSLESSLGSGVANRRKETARHYQISFSVLSLIGELCSRGTPNQARKAPKGDTWIPLTKSEKAWLEAAVKLLIHRAGEIAFDRAAEHKMITMDDLPAI